MMFNRSEIAAVHAAASRCDGVVTRTKSFFKKAGASVALATASALSFAQTSGSTAIDTTQLTNSVDATVILAGLMAVGAVLALIYGGRLVILKVLDLIKRG